MQPRTMWRLAVAASFFVLAACTTNNDPTPVGSVQLFPPNDSTPVGGTRQLEVQVFDRSNNRLEGRKVTYHSNDATVATVDDNGVLRGVKVGASLIVATAEGKTGTANWKVIAAINQVAVAPLSSDLPLGSSRQLAANVLDAAGNAISGRPVTWSSSNAAIATVSVSGVVSAVALGRVTITAAVEGKTGTSTIDVVDPVATVRMNPVGPQTLRIGGRVQLTATPLNAAGQALTGRTTNWFSSNPNVASVSSSGEVTAVAVGQTSVSAEIEGRQGQTAVSVTLIPVSTVTLTPSSLALFRGEQRQLTLVSTDSTGATITSYQGRNVVFQSTNLPVASVSGAGVVVANDSGSANITVTVDQVTSAPVAVTVKLVPVSTVTVTPNPASVKVGFTQQFVATLRDANGIPLGGRPVTWTVSDTTKATITAAGVLTGVGVTGSTTITVTATAEGVSGTAAVTIIP